ncbi:MAG: HAD-IIB family hydrolase [Bdellovibrionaceae bacterium]|nr:HAD-IIB family hydrolase [Pseudobdellovibrionaceae bacterium]
MRDVNSLLATDIKYLFADIDDTMTTHGKLPGHSYEMLWKLQAAGISVIPVTGRPAGWCDMIARFWPVKAVIGENGAFYFSYDSVKKKMKQEMFFSAEERKKNRTRLDLIAAEVLKNVPGTAISSDQFCREFDLAIDFCEDVPALQMSEVQKIVALFQKHGATAKISSIHVNGWFGDFDKLSMCKNYCLKELGFDISQKQSSVAFCGDSPNDEPMFAFFENSVGVANVKAFEKSLKNLPRYICPSEGADGFVELGKALLKKST